MSQQLFWETSPVTPEVREEIGRAVESEVARTVAGLYAWKLMRDYLGSHEILHYTVPWQFPGTLEGVCERLAK